MRQRLLWNNINSSNNAYIVLGRVNNTNTSISDIGSDYTGEFKTQFNKDIISLFLNQKATY